jgi:peptidoglycan hydrolase CwlO-like protein
MLIDELTGIRKEIELYGVDESDTYEKNDPFLALRQRLAVIGEVNSTVDELKSRIDELESRIDDMQTTIDDLRSTIESMEQS